MSSGNLETGGSPENDVPQAQPDWWNLPQYETLSQKQATRKKMEGVKRTHTLTQMCVHTHTYIKMYTQIIGLQ